MVPHLLNAADRCFLLACHAYRFFSDSRQQKRQLDLDNSKTFQSQWLSALSQNYIMVGFRGFFTFNIFLWMLNMFFDWCPDFRQEAVELLLGTHEVSWAAIPASNWGNSFCLSMFVMISQIVYQLCLVDLQDIFFLHIDSICLRHCMNMFNQYAVELGWIPILPEALRSSNSGPLHWVLLRSTN